ncbi:MerR family DNA-binding protein [Rhodoplanes azumiensis]|uniref:MerR family DNA-binding protein n=1 Tax=Rhodoplanes azumiensis TaxID=1897628 RepID=A0ABW5AI32_9BRAD
MIRYYEEIRLLPPPARQASGYRDYGETDVHRLRFVRRARDLGFEIDRIKDLLRLWSERDRSNAAVKTITLTHLAALEERRRALDEVIGVLRHLAESCEGDGRPHCPIIADLDGTAPAARGESSAGGPAADVPRGGPRKRWKPRPTCASRAAP